jgi:hypothetical protein
VRRLAAKFWINGGNVHFALVGRYGINSKTVAKWKRRTITADAPMEPNAPSSTVVTVEKEAIIAAFHTMIRKKAEAELDASIECARSSLVTSFANGVAKGQDGRSRRHRFRLVQWSDRRTDHKT